MGGYLVNIGDELEQNDLFDTYKNLDGCLDKFFIGLSDSETEGVFKWTDNSLPYSMDWISNQNNDDRNCVYMHHTNNKWKHIKCNEELNFLCEVDPVSCDIDYFNVCPPGFEESFDRMQCYNFSVDDSDFFLGHAQANDACVNMGGYLVSVNDFTEQYALDIAISEEHKGCIPPKRHIGLTKSLLTGGWSWEDGSGVSRYYNWGGNSYNDPSKGCALINTDLYWDDVLCHESEAYICEADMLLFPTAIPTVYPSEGPSYLLSNLRSSTPSAEPSSVPSGIPSNTPRAAPSSLPSGDPSVLPSGYISGIPSVTQSGNPIGTPISVPSDYPSFKSVPDLDYEVLYKNITSTRDKVSVSAALSLMGYLGCALYAEYDSPSSVNELVWKARISESKGIYPYLQFTMLAPSTTYSLFCIVLDENYHATSSLEDVLSFRVPVKTMCCIPVYVVVEKKTVLSESSSLNILHLLPTNEIRGELSVDFLTFYSESINTTTVSVNPFLPSLLKLTSTSGTMSTSLPKNLPLGLYALNFRLIGANALDYEFVYAENMRVLNVVSDYIPDAPEMTSVFFSNNGAHIAISFNMVTNQAGLPPLFPCSNMFSFTNISGVLCQWITSSVVHIPSYSAMSVGVGDNITLLGGSLRAACESEYLESACLLWPNATSATVTVRSPISPEIPEVWISSPSSIGPCGDFVFDLSSSTGSGGRTWKFVDILVSALDNATDTRPLQHFFNSVYNVDALTPAEPHLLKENNTYIIAVALCNFLDACSTTTSHTLTVASRHVPIVSIRGSQRRSVKQCQSLKLYANSYTQSCDSRMSSSNMIFTWEVYDNNFTALALFSIARTQSTFHLPPHAFPVVGLYSVHLSVLHTVSGLTSSTSVKVAVEYGDIIAAVNGGQFQSILFGSYLSLDASNSYDEDVPLLRGELAGLRFLWSCHLVEPVDPLSCGVALSSTNNQTTIVWANSSAFINTTSRINLLVRGELTGVSEVTVYVRVLPPELPQLSILSADLTKVSSNKLKLEAAVKLYHRGIVRWSVNCSAVNFSVASAKPVISVLPKGLHYLSLVLGKNTLPPATWLAFTLSSGLAYSSVSVKVAGAPVRGELSVSPNTGIALDQVFTLSASKFTDSELPLTYIFGYLTESESVMTIQTKSESTTASSILPQGTESSEFGVPCVARVFNILDAYTDVTVSVTVRRSVKSAKELQNFVASSLTESSYFTNTDQTKQAIAWGVMTLNTPKCSVNCTALNRRSCFYVANVCGKCRDGFIGDESAPDTTCIAFSSFEYGRGISGCYLDSDCSTFEVCLNGICVGLNKTCPLECSRRGLCSRVDTFSKELRDVCFVGDTSCVSLCICEMGYMGVGCEHTTSDMDTIQQTRTIMIESLVTLISRDDVSEEVLKSMIDLVYELGRSQFELTHYSCDLLLRVMHTVLHSSMDLHLSYDVYLKLPSLLSNCIAVYSISENNISNQHKIRDSTDHLDQLTTHVFRDLTIGENPVAIIEGSFRRSISVAASSSHGELKVSSPHSAVEIMNRVPASYVSFNRSGEGNLNIEVALTEFSLFIYPNSSSFVSYPLKLSVSNSRAIRGPVIFNFTVQRDIKFSDAIRENKTFTTNCGAEDKGVAYSYSCPGGYLVNHTCDGAITILSTKCPVQGIVPLCSVLINGEMEINTLCRVSSYSSRNVVCICGDGPTRRHLQSIFTESTSIEVLAMSHYIGYNFVDTIYEADDFAVEDLKSSIAVLLMFGAMWLSVQFVVVVISIFDNRKSTPSNTMTTTTNKEAIRRSAGGRAKSPVSSSPDVLKKYLMEHFHSLFPLIFRPDGVSWRVLYDEIKKHHRYVVIFAASGPDSDSVRLRVAIQMLTVQSMLMFLLVNFYDLQYPVDDGSCVLFTSEHECTRDRSMFDSDVKKCTWISDESNSFCEYKEVELTLSTVIVIGTLMAIFAAPINLVLDCIFNQIISAPTADDEKALKSMVETKDRVTKRLSRVASKTYSSIFNASQLENSFRFDNIRKSMLVEETRKISVAIVHSHAMTSLAVRNASTVSKPSMGLGIIAEEDKDNEDRISDEVIREECSQLESRKYGFNDFVSKMGEQHRMLKGETRRRFQRSWLLDEKGNIKKFKTTGAGKTVSVEKFLRKEIENVELVARAKIRKLRCASDIHIGLELCHMFIVDFLGRTTPEARIFEYKTYEEFGHSFVVTRLTKMLAWFIVLLINFFFILFTLLRASQRDKTWQYGYIIACIIQMIVELFVFEVRDEVMKAVGELFSAVDCFVSNTPSDLVLDAPEFLFVSNRVAKAFPQLFESSVILSHHTCMGGLIVDKMASDVETKSSDLYGRICSTLRRWMSAVTFVGIMKYIGTLPLSVQRLVVHTIQPAFITLVLYAVTLMVNTPWVTVIVVCIFFYQIGMYILYARRSQKSDISRIPLVQSESSEIRALMKSKPSGHAGRGVSTHGIVPSTQPSPHKERDIVSQFSIPLSPVSESTNGIQSKVKEAILGANDQSCTEHSGVRRKCPDLQCDNWEIADMSSREYNFSGKERESDTTSRAETHRRSTLHFIRSLLFLPPESKSYMQRTTSSEPSDKSSRYVSTKTNHPCTLQKIMDFSETGLDSECDDIFESGLDSTATFPQRRNRDDHKDPDPLYPSENTRFAWLRNILSMKSLSPHVSERERYPDMWSHATPTPTQLKRFFRADKDTGIPVRLVLPSKNKR